MMMLVVYITVEENDHVDLFTKHIAHSVLGFHWITHQKVLCVKALLTSK